MKDQKGICCLVINMILISTNCVYAHHYTNGYFVKKETIINVFLFIIIGLVFAVRLLFKIIEERRNVEIELKNNLKFMNKLMDTIPHPIYYKDKNGYFIGCNKQFEEIAGRSKDHIIGYNVYDIVPKKDAHFHDKRDKELLKSGGQQSYESRINIKQNQVAIFSKAVYRNHQGKIEGFIGVVVDITERKKAEEELRESEERYRTLVELLPDGVAITENKKIEFINRAGAKLFGIGNYKNFVGQSFLQFVHKDSKDMVNKNVCEVREHNKNVHIIEQKAIKRTGTLFDIEVIAAPFYDGGKLKEIAVLRDITERKKAEELRRKMTEKIEQERIRAEFFSNLSHELRTPLNVIFSSVQLLEMENHECLSKCNANNINSISKKMKALKRNGYRLLRLINNLIDITQMDSGYFELNMRNCNIVSVIEDISMSVAEYLEKKNISLLFDTEVEEKIISCDPEKILRIILNLFSNAIKFTHKNGKIMVNIYDQGHHVLITVQDTGIGIPEDQVDEIFDTFRQVDKSIRRNREGIGIGLALVKSLVEMHKGTIEVRSEYGKGSIFIIKLPAKKLEYEEDEKFGKGVVQEYVEKIDIEFSDIYE